MECAEEVWRGTRAHDFTNSVMQRVRGQGSTPPGLGLGWGRMDEQGASTRSGTQEGAHRVKWSPSAVFSRLCPLGGSQVARKPHPQSSLSSSLSAEVG